MDATEAARFLFGLRRYPPRKGIEPTRALLEHLDVPHLDDPNEGVRYVQIAGSNGKGSTARMAERALREAGLDVGLYTSPHLDSVRERVTVNGRRVTKGALTEYAERIRPYVLQRAAEGEAPTFFEALTGLALWAFERENVDVGVLEVGIGGRYDATSAVAPVASAVTTVTLEHTDVLGDTVEEIARDMAEVAPADRPLITAATGDALDAIRAAASDTLTVADVTDGDVTSDADDSTTATQADVRANYAGREGIEGRVSLSGSEWGVETRLALLGRHQATNAGIAAALARQVADVSTAALETGLRVAEWPGRCEVMDRDPLVVLDGAHNPAACERLADAIDEFEYEDLHLVVGALCGKDHAGMAAALPTPDRVVATRPAIGRAEDERVIAEVFKRAGASSVETKPAVADALTNALDAADPADCVLVAGSLYTVAEARTRWSDLVVPHSVESTADARRVLDRVGISTGDTGARPIEGDAVHRVFETRVRKPDAEILETELRGLGGRCVIPAIGDDHERRPAVLLGTHAQLRELADRLEDRAGLSSVVEDLRAALEDGGAAESPTGAVGGETNPEFPTYPWEEGTAVMGILNVTPDSFHDGGEFETTQRAVERAEEMVAEGADIVDVGGESTRPGAKPVPPEDERARVLPVIERIAGLDVTVSVDTRHASVARAALDAGADVINDVSGLEDPEMRFVAAEYDCPVVVMHSIETPVDPDTRIDYDDVVGDVLAELHEVVRRAERAGIDREHIVVDPGLGFGKRRHESFELLGRLGELGSLGCPVLVGHSHKSMFDLVASDPDERSAPTVAATALAAQNGADIVRVHDVAENAAAVRVSEATRDPDTVPEE